MSYFDEMLDTDEDSYLQPLGNVFYYQGRLTNPYGGTDTSLNSYFAVVDFVNRFLDNRDSILLTTPENLPRCIFLSDHVFEIERRIGSLAPSALSRPSKDRFDALSPGHLDRRYFIPALDSESPEKFAEVKATDVFEDRFNEISGAPETDTGHDRTVWSMFCRVRDRDGDRKPGMNFHMYFVRRLRNPKRGVLLSATSPVLGKWPDHPQKRQWLAVE